MIVTGLILPVLVITVGKLIDHYVPSLGTLPLLKTRRDVRQMLPSGYHIDYAGQWRYGIGMQSVGMVARDASPAELRYCGRANPLPVDPHRELTGGL
jgi:hypothetical protein